MWEYSPSCNIKFGSCTPPHQSSHQRSNADSSPTPTSSASPTFPLSTDGNAVKASYILNGAPVVNGPTSNGSAQQTPEVSAPPTTVYRQQLGLLHNRKPIFSSLSSFPCTSITAQSTGMRSQMVFICRPLNSLMTFRHNRRKTRGWGLLQVKIQLQRFGERLVGRFKHTWYLTGRISICSWAQGSM